ncbi:hypothetical protein ACVGVM_02470 [Pseudonocardia bannensis]|uniref:Uncharacterized protein n=1 Tax=Pseudonocardia bannensis TaxID=630973 RepID=A0A848DHE8_9PSEU|nr:hypothetical protein [Pseudonocardia bannensis]NMH91963.1 hypothetical protein [Pseudonocardia bannensis]
MPSFRDRRRSRQRPSDESAAASATGAALPPDDPELDSYLAALSPESEQGVTELTGRFGSAQVFALRLPALRIEQLRRLAAERGVSPGAMAVEWVIDRLDREDTPTGPLPRIPDEPASRGGNPLRLGRRKDR